MTKQENNIPLAKLTLPLLTLFLLGSCVKQISLNLRTPPPQLVVEGLLLTDSTPCTVTLSYSGIFNYAGGQVQNFIDDAVVFVKDGLGDSTQLYNMGSGQYMSPGSINAKAGDSWWLSIKLSNGKQYASFPEVIQPAVKNIALDSIGETNVAPLNSNSPYALYAANITIKTQDPGNQKNYYRWMTTDWIPRQASGITGPACANTGQQVCFVYCWQYYQDKTVYILSDADVNGSEIINQTVLVSPYYIFGSHYINIKQLSLTPQAYEFWQLYQQQTGRTGSILDPLPASLQGNIYNVNDSTDVALGYFEASDVASLRFIFSPVFINAYLTLANSAAFVNPGACYLIYAPATTNAPPGWQNAPQHIVDIY